MSGRTLSAIAVPVVCLAAVGQGDVVRDSTGYPGNPGYVSGGRFMNTYVSGGNYGVTAMRGLDLPQPSQVTNIAGVMAAASSTYNWAASIPFIRINVFSSTSAFAANPQVGDIYSSSSGVTIENLVGTVPPAWGGTNFNGFVNRYVDLAFPPFTLPAGSYLISVIFGTNANSLGWIEALHDYSLPGDVVAFSTLTGQSFEYSGASPYTTGDAAVRIEATPVAPACAADMGSTGGTPGPDGVLDNNDFIVFIDAFFASNPAADFGATGGVPGPDGHFDNNDFVVFIDRFFAGCGA